MPSAIRIEINELQRRRLALAKMPCETPLHKHYLVSLEMPAMARLIADSITFI